LYVPLYSAEAKNAWAYTLTSIPSALREDFTWHNSDNTVTLLAWLLCLQAELKGEIFLWLENVAIKDIYETLRFKYGALCMKQQKAEEFSGRRSTEGGAGLYSDLRSWRLSTGICDNVKERMDWHI